MIQIQHLKKVYNKKKEVLKDINLEIEDGEFYGIFGKNGAGKSTLFKQILGLQKSTAGQIIVNGKVNGFHKEIGYLPENIAVYPHLSVADNLKVAALCADADLSKKEISRILQDVSLEENGKTKAKDLSLGMKRRLQFAMATMTKPANILILDEPTNGLDINGVLWMRDYLKGLHKQNKTILICSHSLDTMEEIITHYCILKDGNIVKEGKWNVENSKLYKVKIAEEITTSIISKLENVFEEVYIKEGQIIVKSDLNIMDFVLQLHKMGIVAKDIDKYREKLESIFIESVNGQ
ncbi:MAG: ABC transporter ATP-binding protein [Lachnospiraceae bacterium]|nr:ABC transporter ATP-binding protein [Lachnospiraceae bacterium]